MGIFYVLDLVISLKPDWTIGLSFRIDERLFDGDWMNNASHQRGAVESILILTGEIQCEP